MVATKFVKLFSIAVIAAFLVSAEAAEGEAKNCPQIKAKNEGKKAKYLVVLDRSVENAADTHLQMMKTCYSKTVQNIVKNTNGKKLDQNTINNLSTDGGMQVYAAFFTADFAEEVGKMKNVKYVEEDKGVKASYAVPQNLFRRTVDNNPKKNDDRIDQAKRPLDGKFIFPDSAGKGVNIFVVDTGILTTHSEFGGRAKFGGSFCEGCNDKDESGHGTNVASIAAGKTLGVARNANLIAVRVLDAKGSGTYTAFFEGLNFVLDQHKNGKNKNSVVNMSLEGSFSQAVNEKVKDLTDAGIHVAVAAGNNKGEDACNSSPASEPSAVTVGATEENSEVVTNFSNIGKCLDIFAPGRNIEGAGIKNNNANSVFSGTSQATPHVAGTLALMIAKDGNKSPADLAKDLLDLATDGVVTGINGDGSPNKFLRIPAP